MQIFRQASWPLLGLLQGGLKAQPRPDHPGEDIVGGAVEDAGDLLDLVGGQALVQGSDDRDAAPHAGLEQIADPLVLGQLEQFAAVLGHQLLVGGDHTLARGQGPAGEIQGHLGPADGLHHDVDLWVVLDDAEVMDDLVGEGTVGEVPHVQDILEPNEVVHLFINVRAVGGQHLGHTGTYHAETQDCYVHHDNTSFTPKGRYPDNT